MRDLLKTDCFDVEENLWYKLYYDGENMHQFMGKHEGTLSEKILGSDTDKKWSDLWYIYQPSGYDKTLAQMTDEERENRIKYESVDSMKEFAKWYRAQNN